MKKKFNLPRWIDVYPQGTKEGDEEQLFFIALVRNPEYQYRSISALAKETALSPKRVEEIIQKYAKLGMILPSSTHNHWGYWERITEYMSSPPNSLSQEDHKRRIENNEINP